MKLDQKITIVLGGTGGVGEGIVRALLQEGALVIVPSRNQIKLNRLKDYVADIKTGELMLHLGSVNEPESANHLSDFLQENFKLIDLAVVSLGGWHQGFPLYNYPMEDWNRILNDNLICHFLAIKTLIPLLNPQHSFYFHINGFSAEQPYPTAGPVALTAAAQKSMILTLAEEVNRTGIKVYELILGPMKTRDRLKYGHGQDDWYFPEEIGNYILDLVDKDQTNVVQHLLKKI
ncbi:MAG: SDR family oxidoreductase [Bacteroidota bacterium]|nr:SDR family oxidoreductase [Bacteroidota bacterium]